MLFYPQNSACNVFSPDLNYLNGMIKTTKNNRGVVHILLVKQLK